MFSKLGMSGWTTPPHSQHPEEKGKGSSGSCARFVSAAGALPAAQGLLKDRFNPAREGSARGRSAGSAP